jgi:hypothetical protein
VHSATGGNDEGGRVDFTADFAADSDATCRFERTSQFTAFFDNRELFCHTFPQVLGVEILKGVSPANLPV